MWKEKLSEMEIRKNWGNRLEDERTAEAKWLTENFKRT